jgi:hypothetical protein
MKEKENIFDLPDFAMFTNSKTYEELFNICSKDV